MAELSLFDPLARESTPTVIAKRIRASIIAGELAPGRQLSEKQLSMEFRVSRGPVREAMQRLVQEGLLRSEPNRGVFVVTLDQDDIAEIYLVRKAIEQTAALLVLRHGDTADLNELDAVIQQLARSLKTAPWPVLAALDSEFHETLVRLSRSKRLMRAFSTLIAETRICLMHLEPAFPSRQRLISEHQPVVDAIRSRREDLVLKTIAEHMDTAVLNLSRIST